MRWRRRAAALPPLSTQLYAQLSSIAGAQQLPNGIVVSHQKLKGRRNNTMLQPRIVLVMTFSGLLHDVSQISLKFSKAVDDIYLG